MSKHIEFLARGVFVDKGKILLCHTKGATNTYLPGGHVEFGESAGMALCREIKEELGCRSSVRRFLGVVEHTFKQKGERHCEVNLVFELQVEGLRYPAKPVSMEDYIEFEWASLKRLRASSLEPAALCRLVPVWLASKSGVQILATNIE